MTTVPDSTKTPALKTPTSDLLRETIRRSAVFILLAGLIVLFSIAQPAFININNLMSILQAVAVVAIIGPA